MISLIQNPHQSSYINNKPENISVKNIYLCIFDFYDPTKPCSDLKCKEIANKMSTFQIKLKSARANTQQVYSPQI